MNGAFKKPENSGRGTRLVNVFDLYSDTTVNLELVDRLELTQQDIDRYRVSPGDIFFTRSSLKPEGVAWSAYLEDDVDEEAVFECHVVRARVDRNHVVPGFVSNYARTTIGRAYLIARANLTTMATIDQLGISELPVVLPKLLRQKELLSALDAKRRLRKKMLADADALLGGLDGFILNLIGVNPDHVGVRYVGAVRRRDLQGPLNPERYLETSPAARLDPTRAIPLDQAFDVIEEKISPSKDAPNSVWDCLRIDDLGNEPLDPPQARQVPGSELVGSFFPTRDGDLLIARLGPPLLNGKIVVARNCGKRTICSPEFLVLRPSNGYDSDVGMWVLRSKAFRRVLYSKCRGSTPSRYRLIREDLSGILIPKLSARQQQSIISEVIRRRDEARRLRAEADALWEQAKADFEAALLGPAK